jgi:cation/acetate symporter
MAAMDRARMVNPRLGNYFGIFASAFAAVLLVGLLLEQLQTDDLWVRLAFFVVPMVLYAGYAALSFTDDRADYFAAGRRIPVALNGLVTAVATLGGTGLIAITGILFLIGVDGLALTTGWISGLVVATVLLIPFLRKFGAYTLPSYLGRRFASRTVRVVSAAVLSVPVLLLLAAEIRFGARAAGLLMQQSELLMGLLLVIIAALIAVAGGVRSITWAGVAKGLAAILALIVPITIVAILVSTVPIPQMTHGTLLRSLTRLELSRGLPTLFAPPLHFDLPGLFAEPLGKRFLQNFGALGTVGYMLTVTALMAGIAALPTQLMRAGVSPAVYQSRKSMGWAVVITGFIFLTLAAIAVYLRGMVLDQVIGVAPDRLPAWFTVLQEMGLTSLTRSGAVVTVSSVAFQRDAILFALPIAAGFPRALHYLALAGGLAACLAAMAASLQCLSMMLAEDIVHGIHRDAPADSLRVLSARLAVPVAAAAGLTLSWVPADPLNLALWGLMLSAATGFPVLVLSVLWKRMNGWGATVGLLTGFGLAIVILLGGEMAASESALPIAAAIGMVASTVAAMIASKMSAMPSREVLELVRDMRTPGGETIYDRELRIAKLKAIKPI